jgi:predicted ATPase/class 3 adenylate cyclase
MLALHDVVMAELPTGTVTMLFSDIEGSTLLLSRLGPEYADALDGQRQVLRSAWTAHGGTEMGTEGDSFFVVFPTAGDAVAAAAQGQRGLAGHVWPRGERVLVRMGLHTGSPGVHAGGYVGMDVHRAARIAAAAHGGQVVVSEATAGLVGGSLPTDLTLCDLGSHRLKDLALPERLFQLRVEGLPVDFPALKSLGASSSLPVPVTPLVGRDGELAELGSALGPGGVRLVTLTGPGGSGKTRLAIGVAQRLVRAFPDGVYFVPLASVTTRDVMWTTIAEVLDAPPEGRIPPGFFTHVAHRSALLVLDNLEQLPEADSVVSELLQEAPQVVVVATSRRPLHLQGEFEHPVPPLELPDGHSLTDAESSGAVEMFVQHARRVRPSFTLTADNAADVAAVCRHLDGLPLAIELAAARSKLLSPHALLGRLDSALDISASSRDVPSRQKTLRDTIGWSYDLLDESQQRFFRSLGVFAGGADLDAVQAVTADVLDGADCLDMVGDLVDASLLTISEASDGEPRAGMLEMVRAYALERLGEAQELDDLRVRQARFYVARAEELRDRPLLESRVSFETEHDNFREALKWTRSPEGMAAGSEWVGISARLCNALGLFWQASGYFNEARGWLEGTVQGADDVDRPEMADCLRRLANILRFVGDLEPAQRYATKSVAMCRRLNDDRRLALSLIFLAAVDIALELPDVPRTLYEEALTLARESGDQAVLSFALADFAEMEADAHHYEPALAMLSEALGIERQLSDPYGVTLQEQLFARILCRMGRFLESRERLIDLIPRVLEVNNSLMVTALAEDCAAVLAALNHSREAVRLLGAADERRQRLGTPRDPAEGLYTAEAIERTRLSLSEHEWDEAYRSGRSSTVEEELRRFHLQAQADLPRRQTAADTPAEPGRR